MKKALILLFLLILFCCGSLFAQDVTLTGTMHNPDGSGFNGYLYMQLQVQASISNISPCTGPAFVVGTPKSTPIQIQIVNGSMVNPPKIYGSTCTDPYGVPYLITLKDNSGNVIFTDQWLIVGPTQDIGDITPAVDFPSGGGQYITGVGTVGQLACFLTGTSIGNCPGGGAGVTSITDSAPATGAIIFTGSGVSQSGNTFTFNGGSAGVASINSTTGAFTFSGAGVSCTGTTCTFSGGGGSGTVFCTPNAQTGTTYTLVLADGTASGAACIGTVTMNNAATNAVTIPPNSSVAFPVPDEIDFIQLGAGQTTLVAGAGVTLITPTSLSTRAQNSTIGIRKLSTDTWIVFGDTQ